MATNVVWNSAFFRRLFPPLAGCSPWMDVPDWWVTGAMPAYAARWGGVLEPADVAADGEGYLACGPGRYPRHAGQDREKRGVGEQFLDLPGDVRVPVAQPSDIGGELGDGGFRRPVRREWRWRPRPLRLDAPSTGRPSRPPRHVSCKAMTRPPAPDGPASRDPRHSTDTTGGMASFPADWGREQPAGLRFVDRAGDLVLYGDVGCGKTHPAIAVGRTGLQAHDTGRVLHGLAPPLAVRLCKAKHDNRPGTGPEAIGKAELPVIDGPGYPPGGIEGARLLFQAVADSYETRSVGVRPGPGIRQKEATCSATATASTRHGRIVRFHGESYGNTHSPVKQPNNTDRNRTAQTVQNGRHRTSQLDKIQMDQNQPLTWTNSRCSTGLLPIEQTLPADR